MEEDNEINDDLILEVMRENSELVIELLCSMIKENVLLIRKFINKKKYSDFTYYLKTSQKDHIIILETISYYIRNILGDTLDNTYSILDKVNYTYSNIKDIEVSRDEDIPILRILLGNYTKEPLFRLTGLRIIPDWMISEIKEKIQKNDKLGDMSSKWFPIQFFIIISPFIDMDRLLLYLYKTKPEG